MNVISEKSTFIEPKTFQNFISNESEIVLKEETSIPVYSEVERLRLYLEEKGYIDSQGQMTAKTALLDLPEVDSKIIDRIYQFLNKERHFLFEDDSYRLSLLLCFIYRQLYDYCTGISVIGGTVAHLLGKEFFYSCLKLFEIENPSEFIPKVFLRKIQARPNDNDLRVFIPGLNHYQLACLGDVLTQYLSQLTGKLFEEVLDTFYSKHCHVHLKNGLHYYTQTLKDDSKTELMLVENLVRDHLFTHDALSLSLFPFLLGGNKDAFLNTSLPSLWTPILHKLIMLIDIDDIDTVDNQGFLLYVSYLTRGYACLKPKVERELAEKFIHAFLQNQTNSMSLQTFIKKLIDNHHEESGLKIVFIYNLLFCLKEYLNVEQLEEFRLSICAELRVDSPGTVSDADSTCSKIHLLAILLRDTNLSFVSISYFMSIFSLLHGSSFRKHKLSHGFQWNYFHQTNSVCSDTDLISALEHILKEESLLTSETELIYLQLLECQADEQVILNILEFFKIDLEVFSNCLLKLIVREKLVSHLALKLLHPVLKSNYAKDLTFKLLIEFPVYFQSIKMQEIQYDFINFIDRGITNAYPLLRDRFSSVKNSQDMLLQSTLFLAKIPNAKINQACAKFCLKQFPEKIWMLIKRLSEHNFPLSLALLEANLDVTMECIEAFYSCMSKSILGDKVWFYSHQIDFINLLKAIISKTPSDSKSILKIYDTAAFLVEDCLKSENFDVGIDLLYTIHSHQKKNLRTLSNQWIELWQMGIEKSLIRDLQLAKDLWLFAYKHKLYQVSHPKYQFYGFQILKQLEQNHQFNFAKKIVQRLNVQVLARREKREFFEISNRIVTKILKEEEETVQLKSAFLKKNVNDPHLQSGIDLIFFRKKIFEENIFNEKLLSQFFSLRKKEFLHFSHSESHLKACYRFFLDKFRENLSPAQNYTRFLGQYYELISHSQFNAFFPITVEGNLKYHMFFLDFILKIKNKTYLYLAEKQMNNLFGLVFIGTELQMSSSEAQQVIFVIIELLELCIQFRVDLSHSTRAHLNDLNYTISSFLENEQCDAMLLRFFFVCQRLACHFQDTQVYSKILLKELKQNHRCMTDEAMMSSIVHYQDVFKNNLDKYTIEIYQILIQKFLLKPETIKDSICWLKSLLTASSANRIELAEIMEDSWLDTLLNNNEVDICFELLSKMHVSNDKIIVTWVTLLRKTLEMDQILQAVNYFNQLPIEIFNSHKKEKFLSLHRQMTTQLTNTDHFPYFLDFIRYYYDESYMEIICELIEKISQLSGRKNLKGKAWNFFIDSLVHKDYFSSVHLKKKIYLVAYKCFIGYDYKESFCALHNTSFSQLLYLKEQIESKHLATGERAQFFLDLAFTFLEQIKIPLDFAELQIVDWMVATRKELCRENEMLLFQDFDAAFIKKFSFAQNISVYHDVCQVFLDSKFKKQQDIVDAFNKIIENYANPIYEESDLIALKMKMVFDNALDFIEILNWELIFQSLCTNKNRNNFDLILLTISNLKKKNINLTNNKLILKTLNTYLGTRLELTHCKLFYKEFKLKDFCGISHYKLLFLNTLKKFLRLECDQCEQKFFLGLLVMITANYDLFIGEKEMIDLYIQLYIKFLDLKENGTSLVSILGENGISLVSILKDLMKLHFKNVLQIQNVNALIDWRNSANLFPLPRVLLEISENQTNLFHNDFFQIINLILQNIIKTKLKNLQFALECNLIGTEIFHIQTSCYLNQFLKVYGLKYFMDYLTADHFLLSPPLFFIHKQNCNFIFQKFVDIEGFKILYIEDILVYLDPKQLFTVLSYNKEKPYKQYTQYIEKYLKFFIQKNLTSTIDHAISILKTNSETFPITNESTWENFFIPILKYCSKNPFHDFYGIFCLKTIIDFIFPKRQFIGLLNPSHFEKALDAYNFCMESIPRIFKDRCCKLKDFVDLQSIFESYFYGLLLCYENHLSKAFFREGFLIWADMLAQYYELKVEFGEEILAKTPIDSSLKEDTFIKDQVNILLLFLSERGELSNRAYIKVLDVFKEALEKLCCAIREFSDPDKEAIASFLDQSILFVEKKLCHLSKINL